MTRAKTLLRTLFSPERHMPSPAAPAGARIYAIGDIHGRTDLFDQLVSRIRTDHKWRGGDVSCEIILLGDLIDRGPDSAGMVDRVLDWLDQDLRLTVLKGNHEASLHAVLDGETRWLQSWLSYGGYECLQSYGVPLGTLVSGDIDLIAAAAQGAVPERHRAWLASLPLMERRGDYCFVHAGIAPGVPLEEQVEADLIWIRDRFLDSPADHGAMIVHGHTIRPEIELLPNRMGLDTGAYYSGKLSAVGLEGTGRWFIATGS